MLEIFQTRIFHVRQTKTYKVRTVCFMKEIIPIIKKIFHKHKNELFNGDTVLLTYPPFERQNPETPLTSHLTSSKENLRMTDKP